MPLKNGRKTALYAACTRPLYDEAAFAACYGKLSPYRREKTDRLLKTDDKIRSVSAETLLRFALENAAGFTGEPEFSFGSENKPYLAGAEELYFSLSHSGDYVLCAVSETECGCDIEKVSDADLRVAKRFFAQGEYENILSQSGREAQNEMFYRCWTVKESFAKAAGLGLTLPFRSFEVPLGENGAQVLQSRDGEKYAFAEFPDIPGYKCALCVKDGVPDAELYIADLREMI